MQKIKGNFFLNTAHCLDSKSFVNKKHRTLTTDPDVQRKMRSIIQQLNALTPRRLGDKKFWIQHYGQNPVIDCLYTSIVKEFLHRGRYMLIVTETIIDSVNAFTDWVVKFSGNEFHDQQSSRSHQSRSNPCFMMNLTEDPLHSEF